MFQFRTTSRNFFLYRIKIVIIFFLMFYMFFFKKILKVSSFILNLTKIYLPIYSQFKIVIFYIVKYGLITILTVYNIMSAEYNAGPRNGETCSA